MAEGEITGHSNVPVVMSGEEGLDVSRLLGKADVKIDDEENEVTITMVLKSEDFTLFLKRGTLQALGLNAQVYLPAVPKRG